MARGSEAVATFTENAPDVRVLDIGLPDADGRDGWHAPRRGRRRRPRPGRLLRAACRL
jgi:DNA-binding response OmpR family regulator